MVVQSDAITPLGTLATRLLHLHLAHGRESKGGAKDGARALARQSCDVQVQHIGALAVATATSNLFPLMLYCARSLSICIMGFWGVGRVYLWRNLGVGLPA